MSISQYVLAMPARNALLADKTARALRSLPFCEEPSLGGVVTFLRQRGDRDSVLLEDGDINVSIDAISPRNQRLVLACITQGGETRNATHRECKWLYTRLAALKKGTELSREFSCYLYMACGGRKLREGGVYWLGDRIFFRVGVMKGTLVLQLIGFFKQAR